MSTVAELGRRRAALNEARRGCADACPCHAVAHHACPNAKPCLGRCGRLTTAHESTSCGYCVHCASDPRWIPLEALS